MSPVGNTSKRRWRTGVPTQQGSEINTSAIKHNISCLSVTMVTEWEISTDIITPSDAVWCACAELMSLQHRFNPADHQINPGSGLTETSGGDQCRQNGTLLIDTHHYAASQSMFVLRVMEPAGRSAETRARSLRPCKHIRGTFRKQTQAAKVLTRLAYLLLQMP